MKQVYNSSELRLVTIYEAREDLDKQEGRGGSRHIGYFLNELDAVEASRGMGPMGYASTPSKHTMATIDGVTGFLCFKQDRIRVCTDASEAKRVNALSKLTDEDLKILGLSRNY